MDVKSAIALLLACAFLDCAGGEAVIPDLSCELARKAAGECTPVPSLVVGRLALFSDGTFEMKARYEACYGVEEVEMEGAFQASPHVSGVDLELLAKRVSGGDLDAEDFSRTIGTVSLDPRTWDGQFTDTAMTFRSRGSVGEAPPVLAMSCSKK